MFSCLADKTPESIIPPFLSLSLEDHKCCLESIDQFYLNWSPKAAGGRTSSVTKTAIQCAEFLGLKEPRLPRQSEFCVQTLSVS